jgi:hypothetical protein
LLEDMGEGPPLFLAQGTGPSSPPPLIDPTKTPLNIKYNYQFLYHFLMLLKLVVILMPIDVSYCTLYHRKTSCDRVYVWSPDIVTSLHRSRYTGQRGKHD